MIFDSGCNLTANVQVVPKAWRERANTIGYISGGMDGQVPALRQVLGKLPCNGKSVLKWKKPNGEEASAICDDLCGHQLSTAGLAERAANGDWIPSHAAAEWLRNDDPSSLACHLHVNVKFFGELLAAVGSDTNQMDLLQVARDSYGMNWGTPDQVRRRVGWLRSLGMVELWSQRVVRTAEGDSLLRKLQLCSTEEARGEQMSDLTSRIEDADLLECVSTLANFDQEALRARRPLIGYIPRGINSANKDVEDAALKPTAAVRKLIDIVGSGLTVEEFRESCAELGISKSSSYGTLHTLRHMGLIEQTEYNFFTPTSNAQWLVRDGNESAFVAYLHTRYLFFGEILENLATPSSPSQLVKLAKER